MKTYKSKFGYEIIIFLTLVFGSSIGLMIYMKEPLEDFLSAGGIFILVYGFFLYLNFSTEYTITNDALLKIKCGFLYNKRFDINKIRSIAQSNNLISSPAPSLDRLEFIYGKYDLIIISPKDKVGFVKELIKMNPSIENKLSK